MSHPINLEEVFRKTVSHYDAISPKLTSGDFESYNGNPSLVRAHIPPEKKEAITLQMLVDFNNTGSPNLQLSYQEGHSLANSMLLVKGMLGQNAQPSPEHLENILKELVDYKENSGGEIGNALTSYLCAKALEYVGEQTGEGSGNVDLSPLEIALGIK